MYYCMPYNVDDSYRIPGAGHSFSIRLYVYTGCKKTLKLNVCKPYSKYRICGMNAYLVLLH